MAQRKSQFDDMFIISSPRESQDRSSSPLTTKHRPSLKQLKTKAAKKDLPSVPGRKLMIQERDTKTHILSSLPGRNRGVKAVSSKPSLTEPSECYYVNDIGPSKPQKIRRTPNLKNALHKMASRKDARMPVYDPAVLERDRIKYERFLEELKEQQDAQSPGSPGGTIDTDFDLESLALNEEDTEFLRSWAKINKEYTEKQNISYQMMAQALAAANRPAPRRKFTTDHSGYLERKDQRLKSAQETSSKKIKQTKRRLSRLHNTGTPAAQRQFYAREPTVVHTKLPGIPMTAESRAELFDVDEAVETWEAAQQSVSEKLTTSPPGQAHVQGTKRTFPVLLARKLSARAILGQVGEAINEVDCCLETVRNLKEGGGCSRTEVLLSSITRLHVNLTTIEQKYAQVTGMSLNAVTEGLEDEAAGDLVDTEEYAFEAYEDMYKKMESNNEDVMKGKTPPVPIDEATAWDNYYDSLIADYFILKAMISGKVDDTQSFDRKVFALTFEHGKCPVSWREIFSMARHKLRELVCYPYANEGQIRMLMDMENATLYSTWQTEVMNKIKDKLSHIKETIQRKSKLIPGGGAKWKKFAQKVTKRDDSPPIQRRDIPGNIGYRGNHHCFNI